MFVKGTNCLFSGPICFSAMESGGLIRFALPWFSLCFPSIHLGLASPGVGSQQRRPDERMLMVLILPVSRPLEPHGARYTATICTAYILLIFTKSCYFILCVFWILKPEDLHGLEPSCHEAVLWNFAICVVSNTLLFCVCNRAVKESAVTTSWDGWGVWAAQASCDQHRLTVGKEDLEDAVYIPPLCLNGTDDSKVFSLFEAPVLVSSTGPDTSKRKRRRLECWRPAVCTQRSCTELLMFCQDSSRCSAQFYSITGCVRGVAGSTSIDLHLSSF